MGPREYNHWRHCTFMAECADASAIRGYHRHNNSPLRDVSKQTINFHEPDAGKTYGKAEVI